MTKILSGIYHRARTLEQASVVHNEVAEAVKVAANPWQGELSNIWRELTGQTSTEDPPAIALSIRFTCPADLLALMSVNDDIVSAFAFAHIVAAFDKVDPADDLAVRDALTHVWKLMADLASNAAAIEEGFGCDLSAAWRTLRKIRDVRDQRMLKKMVEIAQLAGRMFKAMRPVRRPVVTDDPQEVRGIERGGDIARLTPAELAKLGTPKLADMQTMKVLKKDATQRRMSGKRHTTRGPLAIAFDESGSMHDEGDAAGRNTWAKACGLALARIAHGENRRVVAIHYSTATTVQDVPAGNPQALIDMAMHFMGGGTAFVPAVKASVKQVERLKAEGFDGADIVMISDGEDGGQNRDELTKLMTDFIATGGRFWAVAIGCSFTSDHPFRAHAERYVSAHDADLRNRKRAIGIADELSAAATADGKRWN